MAVPDQEASRVVFENTEVPKEVIQGLVVQMKLRGFRDATHLVSAVGRAAASCFQ
ncbi:uncharacterized protein MYCFIDRAFT_169304 [Pseudocercospora fijiensis CIRAD86]|uniref:Uncharacterized protein n=1 Tax=Pseudocercospora fijiensis (strain CIRAD86) TaxID=383855 RepID=N1Q5Y6_PSEFD|nr:uncharacterized protein MYCFIDRAFT_169304 [Pseudocercospora fijiensis CIRAD86]EME87484.1 hypothetical protein MYCFIDRAFT_169304 [Pseudocercospora fijiensis CIRAD86]